MRRSLFALVFVVIVAGISAICISHPSYGPYKRLELTSNQPRSNALRATFFGVSTILLADDKSAILVDGFFSRPSARRLLLGRIAPDPRRIESALPNAHEPKLSAVLVAHSHYDHALDAATVAMRDGALLIGSESTANIARGEGFQQDRIRTVHGGEHFQFEGFKVQVFRSIHSPHAMFEGQVDAPLIPPAWFGAYREGGAYSYLVEHGGRTILIHPSANFIPGMYRGVHANVVFLGIGRMGQRDKAFVEDYWREVVQTTGAGLVIPVHWDDITVPLEKPLQPMPRVADDFDQSMRWLEEAASCHGVALRLMPVGKPVDVLDPAALLPGAETNKACRTDRLGRRIRPE